MECGVTFARLNSAFCSGVSSFGSLVTRLAFWALGEGPQGMVAWCLALRVDHALTVQRDPLWLRGRIVTPSLLMPAAAPAQFPGFDWTVDSMAGVLPPPADSVPALQFQTHSMTRR